MARKIALWSVVFPSLLPLLLCACGRSGGQPAAPAPQPTLAPPVAPLSLATAVGINPLNYSLPPVTDCLQSAAATPLIDLGSKYQVDGHLTGWAGVAPILSSPGAPTPLGAAVGNVLLGRAGDDLAVGVATQASPTTSLNFEWGGMLIQGGQLHRQVRRLLRFYQGQFQDYDNGTWTPVTADLGSGASGPDGVEVRLTRRLLGDVVTWPVWWLRVYSRNEAAGTLLFSSAAGFQLSILQQDDAPFSVASCQLWASSPAPIVLTQITDALPPSAAAKAPANTDWTAVTKQALQLSRAAYNAAGKLLGGTPLPVGQLPVVVTANDVLPVEDSTGIDPSYVGRGDLYRGLAVDVKTMAPSSTINFPQGPVFAQLAAGVLDLGLQARVAASPPDLLIALRQALLDEVEGKTLGMTYVLDNLPFDTASVLAGGAAAAPGSLAGPKAVNFGHLLAGLVSYDALISAWSDVGARNPTSAQVASDLATALGSETKLTALVRSEIPRLWLGWLSADAYDPSFAPSSLGDSDSDGLPDFLETKYGSDPHLADTTNNGWTDALKVELGLDPTSMTSIPNLLAPDGDFQEWENMLPKRLIAGKGQPNGTCPKAATIGYFAAIANHDTILISAYAQDYLVNEPKARWEVEFDFVTDKVQALLTAQGSGHTYELRQPKTKAVIKSYRRAAPLGQQTFDVAFNRSVLPLPTNLDAAGAVTLQIRTVYSDAKGDHFCDATDWISPLTTSD